MTKAVLVIDVQQGLCEGAGAAFDCPGTIKRINTITTTTRRALALGYPVLLVSDAHTSAGNAAIDASQVIAHHNATLTNISSFGPRVQALTHGEIEFAP